VTVCLNEKGAFVKGEKEIKIPCPVCGKRICDGKGLPEGVFEIELKCKSCGYVWLDAKYLRKFLDIPAND